MSKLWCRVWHRKWRKVVTRRSGHLSFKLVTCDKCGRLEVGDPCEISSWQ